MSTIEETLKAAYLDNGGSASGFEGVKGQVLAAYRKQAALDAARWPARRCGARLFRPARRAAAPAGSTTHRRGAATSARRVVTRTERHVRSILESSTDNRMNRQWMTALRAIPPFLSLITAV